MSDIQGIPERSPLFSVRTTMNLSLYQKLCWAVSGKRLALSGVLLAALGAVFVLSYFSPVQSVFWFFLWACLLFPLLLYFCYRRSIRINYESTKLTQDLCTEYAFWGDHFCIKNKLSKSQIAYDSLYAILETKTAFYLLVGRNQGLILEKSICPDGLPALLRSLAKQPPAMRKLDIAALCSLAACLLGYLGYLCICCFQPEGCLLRRWVPHGFAPCLLILFAFSFAIFFISLFTGRLTRIRSAAKRRTARVLSVILALFIIAFSLFAALLLLIDPDQEIQNDDGTVTVRHSVWLDKPVYTNYIPQGLFYLRPEESAFPADDPDLHESSPAPTPAASGGSVASAPVLSNQEKGYQAVYDFFLADTCPLYEEYFHAKGNSYILVNDTDSFAEILEYDRDSQNGQCGLYVYYRCPKSQDGSWSVQEQEILNIYAYEYASGAIAVSGKTSWSAPASKAYLDLTGE